MTIERRRLGDTDTLVSAVAMGCWPIAGMTSLDVNDTDSLATLNEAFDLGINFFDTAYCYGANGESERLISRALGAKRDDIVIASKAGIHWEPDGSRVHDASAERLQQECEESLRRLDTDRIDLYYLHSPDPATPLSESAAALKRLLDEGKVRAVGISNANVEQLEEFSSICPLAAFQPHYNMLQREIEQDTLPWCRERRVSVIVYWPLMKGLLAGELRRDHQFDPRDGRAKYPMFQGEEWQKNQDFLEVIRDVAERSNRTVAQVAINWTIHRPGITAALCGAKRPWQIRDNAAGAEGSLTGDQLAEIDQAIRERGPVASRSAVR